MKKLLLTLFCVCFSITVHAEENILNLYAYTGEIPDVIVRQFEKETGIKVNFTTYENNEIMYAKQRAAQQSVYDLVMPSSYFVDRMRRQNMLEKLDKTKLPNWKNLSTDLTNPAYDPQSQYSVPFIWGVSGIFVNQRYYSPDSITKWSDLWEKRFRDQLLMLDDTRELFSIALLTLGYSANDQNPEHLQAAFLKLKELIRNIKVFSTDTVVSIIIDEDARAGMVWNGDLFKAAQENKNIKFILPKEGFMIWVDTFAIPKDAPHKESAYAFINFMLRPDVAKTIALVTNYPIANAEGKKLLPATIRDNPIVYPSKEILSHGQFQTDVSDETLALLEKYWEELKMT